MSRKGDNTPERPHRRSRIVSVPDIPEIVTVQQLQDLAARLPTDARAQTAVPQETKGYKNILNLPDWLHKHDIAVKSEKPYANGHLYILNQCPFSTAHRDGAFAIQFGSGAVFAGCKHSFCGGGTQRWAELRARFEPDRAEKQKQYEKKQKGWDKERVKAKARAEHAGNTGPELTEDLELQAEAAEVLAHGNPLALMLTAFSQEHVGDEILARCLILSMASEAVKNSDGLHVSSLVRAARERPTPSGR